MRTQGTWVLGVCRFRVAPRLQSVGRLEKRPWKNSSCPRSHPNNQPEQGLYWLLPSESQGPGAVS